MKKIPILLLFLYALCVSSYLAAQKSPYINLTTGPKYDFWEYEGDIEKLSTKPSFSLPFLRLSVERELAANFRASIGADINGHSFTPIFLEENTFFLGIDNVYFGLHLPVLVHYQFFEIEKGRAKIRLIGHAGYQFAVNLDYQSASFSSSGSSGQSFSTTFRNDKQASFNLVEVGGRLELEIFNRWAMLLGGHFAEGFNEVVEGTISYNLSDGVERSTNVFSQGSYYIFEIGAQYRLGKN